MGHLPFTFHTDDLSTNISEGVVFIVNGKVIKHHREGEKHGVEH